MKVLILSNGADNGGVGIAIKQAFDKHDPSVQVRSVRRADNFIQYDNDVQWLPGDAVVGDEVMRLYHEADVVHIMEKFSAIEQFPDWESKPRIMHHHGSVFRGNPTSFVERCKREGIQQLAAIFDVLRFAPDDLIWIPNPVDIPAMMRYRIERYRPTQQVRIVQSPAGRGPNHTGAFLEAMGEVSGAQTLLIEGQTWRNHLAMKAQADAVFDSFTTGYGITLSEGWGMGIPGISGGSDEAVMDLMRQHIGFIPYYAVTEANVVKRMQVFVEDRELRQEVANLGWQAVNDFHAEEVIVAKLRRIYEQALG